MIVTRSIRRFRQGVDQRMEFVRVFEFPVVPVKGMTVDFGDNSGEAVVAHVRVGLRS
jgi:hypothetical protein